MTPQQQVHRPDAERFQKVGAEPQKKNRAQHPSKQRPAPEDVLHFQRQSPHLPHRHPKHAAVQESRPERIDRNEPEFHLKYPHHSVVH